MGQTVLEVKDLIGQQGILKVVVGSGFLYIPVIVQDVRPAVWGRSDYLIQPVNGEGVVWVSADRVKVPSL